MTSSARGLLVAAGTATLVVVVGVVFVFPGGEPPPSEKPAEAQGPDESDLSLEARRQARLTESQAMLGGGRPAPPEPEPPAEPPPADVPDGATVPPVAPGAVPVLPPPSGEARAAAPARAHLRRSTRVGDPVRPVPVDEAAPARVPRPRGLAWQAAPPPKEIRDAGTPGTTVPGPGLAGFRGGRPCTIATSGTSPVAAACRQGGVQEAKKTMKQLVQDARARGARFTCETCHARPGHVRLARERQDPTSRRCWGRRQPIAASPPDLCRPGARSRARTVGLR